MIVLDMHKPYCKVCQPVTHLYDFRIVYIEKSITHFILFGIRIRRGQRSKTSGSARSTISELFCVHFCNPFYFFLRRREPTLRLCKLHYAQHASKQVAEFSPVPAGLFHEKNDFNNLHRNVIK